VPLRLLYVPEDNKQNQPTRKMCESQAHLKKYRERRSPAFPAQACRGQTMLGNDGMRYQSVADKNGRFAWKQSKSPAKKSSPRKAKVRASSKSPHATRISGGDKDSTSTRTLVASPRKTTTPAKAIWEEPVHHGAELTGEALIELERRHKEWLDFFLSTYNPDPAEEKVRQSMLAMRKQNIENKKTYQRIMANVRGTNAPEDLVVERWNITMKKENAERDEHDRKNGGVRLPW
jgi:hypothetical protein